MSTVLVKVKRQDAPDTASYWESFAVPHIPSMNIISVLMAIRENPVTTDGKQVAPVAWDSACLEEVCGSCTMLVNGKVRQSCTVLVDKIDKPIILEPMSKFPVVRDLVVDRSRMFDALKKVRAWIPIDGSYDLGPGPRMAERERAVAYELSRCITCGCCLEVCPQYNSDSAFIGAAAISQVRLFNMHPTGSMHKEGRLDAMMQEGGISDCGNAQNCVKACPKDIPLTDSIAEIGRETTVHAVKRLFG